MIKAVVFDMYETLITLWHSNPYMGEQMSADAGIPEPVFREIWDPSEKDRTLGIRDIESVIKEILVANDVYTLELYEKLVGKRKASKVESFNHLHKEIIPMLEGLKAQGIKIGLVTNCFLEEKEAIEASVLFPYFDAVCMSCVERLKKPDEMIFTLCLDRLGVNGDECIYCGDGGSRELWAAENLGMHPVQALWYLKEGAGQPVGRLEGFEGVKSPMDIVALATEK